LGYVLQGGQRTGVAVLNGSLDGCEPHGRVPVFHQPDQQLRHLRIGQPNQRSDGVPAAQGVARAALIDRGDQQRSCGRTVDLAESVEDIDAPVTGRI
jgi:hypothetical protein